MTGGVMEAEDAKRLLRWYPVPWRARYGDEFLAMIEDGLGDAPPGWKLRWSVIGGGLRERARRSWVIGSAADREQRIRGGSSLVLWAWALLMPAGLSFAKFIEHWQAAVRPSRSTLPSLADGAAGLFAIVGGLAILVAAAVAAPALARSLRSGAWRRLRATAAVAAGLGAAWLAFSVAGVLWAHHLNSAQRNGGSPGYSIAACCWAALTIITVAAWTALAVRSERQLRANEILLRAEAVGALVVTAATTIVTAAVITWWAFMASTAPLFLQGFVVPPGEEPISLSGHASWWTWRLAITAAAMIVATALATAGTIRAWRGRRPITV